MRDSQNFNIHRMGSIVPESASRILDQKVQFEEMPYGYTSNPPAADTGDFDQARLESKVRYGLKNGRAV